MEFWGCYCKVWFRRYDRIRMIFGGWMDVVLMLVVVQFYVNWLNNGKLEWICWLLNFEVKGRILEIVEVEYIVDIVVKCFV